jgi:hypothetical protein
VRRHGGFGIADALAEVDGGDQRGDTGGDVDDGAAGEVEAREAAAGGVEQAADAPDHVGHGVVDEDRPEDEEDGHGAELHALGEGSGDQRRGDDGEHELVDHVGLVGDGGGVVGVGREADAAQEEMLEAADEAVAVPEGQRVADQRPEHGDDAHHGEALHHGAEDVLCGPGRRKEGQAGTGHHQDQGGGNQHPCVVAELCASETDFCNAAIWACVAEVKEGQEWSVAIGEGWIFRLVPIQPSGRGYSGWDLVVNRVEDGGYPDALLVGTPPYGSLNEREIGTTYGLRAQDAIAWNPRRFHFLTSAKSWQRARELFREVVSNPSGEGAGAATRELLGMVSDPSQSVRGQFSLLDARLIPGAGDPPAYARQWAANLSQVPHTIEPKDQ